MSDRRGPCAVCRRPVYYAWQIDAFHHENPNVRNHRARPVPPPPIPVRPGCGCPDYSQAVA